MNILVIYAHPNPKSFNHAILDTIIETAKEHTVRVRDLYELKFNPCLDGEDFMTMASGTYKDDVLEEHKHITWADIIIFVHPIWWTHMPAILKGYFDRVWASGFAYGSVDGKVQGFLSDKKALVFNTTGNPLDVYTANGFVDAIIKTTDVGNFGLAGMEVIDHKFFGNVPTSTDEERANYLQVVKETINNL